jgi:hypothetical protein
LYLSLVALIIALLGIRSQLKFEPFYHPRFSMNPKPKNDLSGDPLLDFFRSLLLLSIMSFVAGAAWFVLWEICQAAGWMNKKFTLPPSSIITVEEGMFLLGFSCVTAFFLFLFAVAGRSLGIKLPKLSVGSLLAKDEEK